MQSELLSLLFSMRPSHSFRSCLRKQGRGYTLSHSQQLKFHLNSPAPPHSYWLLSLSSRTCSSVVPLMSLWRTQLFLLLRFSFLLPLLHRSTLPRMSLFSLGGTNHGY